MQGFRKFFAKFHKHALIKSAGFGVSVAVLAVSTTWLVCKRLGVAISPVWYIAAGVALAAAAFASLYFILRPNQKRVAKALDGQLGLGEKAQTMVEFQNADGDMIALQREDTERRLQNTPLSAVKTGKLWKHLVAPVLAVAMLVVAAVTPMRVIAPVGEEEPRYEYSEYDATRLQELIQKVRESDMETEPKMLIVSDLEDLSGLLETVEYEKDMKKAVVEVIADTVRLERSVNTYDEISAALNASEDENVKSLGGVIAAVDAKKLSEEWMTRRDSFIGENAEKSVAYQQSLSLALNAVTLGRQGDALYKSLQAFVQELKEVNDTLSANPETWQTAVDEAFYAVSQSADAAVVQQNDNKQTADLVVTELMDIFGISASDLPADLLQSGVGSSGGDYSEPEEDKELSSGGLGSGEVVYGSNDTIYYPEEEKYVNYGDVLTEYFKKVSEQLGGDVPEELEQFIRDYFAMLYSGEE